jgi:hypothetical protein
MKKRAKKKRERENLCKNSNNFVYVHAAFSIEALPMAKREKILRERYIKSNSTFISVSDFQKPSNAQHCSQSGY